MFMLTADREHHTQFYLPEMFFFFCSGHADFFAPIISIIRHFLPTLEIVHLRRKNMLLILTLQFFIALSKINTSRHYFVSLFCNH